MNKTALIGIPRYLSYFSFGSMWETFFEELGCEVKISSPSNREILDQGVRETVNDACIPIKLFHGHVMDLRDEVDLLFVPRLGGSTTRYTVCPKFLGLPDMVRNSVSSLPRILSPRLGVSKQGIGAWRELASIGAELAGSRWTAFKALHSARQRLTDAVKHIQQDGLEAFDFSSPQRTDLTVGVVGYPYVVYDHLSNGGLVSQLLQMGIEVLTPEMVDEQAMRRQSEHLSEDVFWYYSNRTLWSGLHFMKSDEVDGIMHVTAFGCGPDAMIGKILEMEAKSHDMPFLSLMVDEHTGGVGLMTRAEAFIDMLRRRLRGGSAS